MVLVRHLTTYRYVTCFVFYNGRYEALICFPQPTSGSVVGCELVCCVTCPANWTIFCLVSTHCLYAVLIVLLTYYHRSQ